MTGFGACSAGSGVACGVAEATAAGAGPSWDGCRERGVTLSISLHPWHGDAFGWSLVGLHAWRWHRDLARWLMPTMRFLPLHHPWWLMALVSLPRCLQLALHPAAGGLQSSARRDRALYTMFSYRGFSAQVKTSLIQQTRFLSFAVLLF